VKTKRPTRTGPGPVNVCNGSGDGVWPSVDLSGDGAWPAADLLGVDVCPSAASAATNPSDGEDRRLSGELGAPSSDMTDPAEASRWIPSLEAMAYIYNSQAYKQDLKT